MEDDEGREDINRWKFNNEDYIILMTGIMFKNKISCLFVCYKC